MTQIAEGKIETFNLTINPNDVDKLLEKEWLLTNNRGSYASGTFVFYSLN